MNKKFSTLLAGFLLAGGVLSNASAVDLTTLAGNGKYYKLVRTALKTQVSGSDKWLIDQDETKYYLDDEVLTSVADNASYWAVVDNGDGTYSLKNFKGDPLVVNDVTNFSVVYRNALYDDPSQEVEHNLFKAANSTYLGNTTEDDTYPLAMLPSTGLTAISLNGFDVVDGSELAVDVLGFNHSLLDGEKVIPAVRFIYNNGNNEYLATSDIFKVSYDKTTGTYSFTHNKTDEKLIAEGSLAGVDKFYLAYDPNHGAYLQDPATSKYVQLTIVDGNVTGAKLVDDLEETTFLGFATVDDEKVPVSSLNVLEKDGFSVTIYHDTKDDCLDNEDHLATDIAGNPFVGHLTTMSWNGSEFKSATSGTEFYLKNSDGDYIVAQKYEGEGAWSYQTLYGFTTVSEADLKHNLIRSKNGLEDQKYFGYFYAIVDGVDFDADPDAITKVSELAELYVSVNGGDAKVGRYDFTTSQIPTLVASIGTSLKPILISLGDREIVDWTEFVQKKFFTVKKTTKDAEDNGWAVAKESGKAWVASYGNELEGQWALTVTFSDAKNTKASVYKFTNRENTGISFTLPAQTLYYVSGSENTYKQGGETYVITPVETTDADGYERLDVKDEMNQKWNIAFTSGVFGAQAYLTENHKDGDKFHLVGLDTDVDNALQFTIKKYAAARKVEEDKDEHEFVYTPTDTIYVISTLGTYNKKNGYVPAYDTLKVVSYSFVNQWNEPLRYGKIDNISNNAYYSDVYYDKVRDEDPTSIKDPVYVKFANASLATAHKYAQKFAIRVDNGKYNLRPVSFSRTAQYETKLASGWEAEMYQVFNNNWWGDLVKMYAGDATNGILNNTGLYERTENDLFVIEPTEKEIYRRLQNEVDTVSIYRDSNEKSLLYEKTTEIAKDQFVNFLGMENIADFTGMAPAMIADTAYVRYETYKPQYMLVVDPEIVPAGNYCPIHGANATCEHATPTKGWISGRYLVNLVDSAKAWADANKHQVGNPYVNSEGWYKLGFVQATHKNDTLAIARAEATENDSIFVGDIANKIGKYAFRYVDTETKSFVIETSLDGSATPGYLKWMNGVVVVIPDIAYADVYNMNEEEGRTPTANDAIAASEVSVVATQGAVIVKGAAGKKVAISNILGQTVANTVISSDNATIAAPAGIVVVAVEGEDAVKVVVK